MKVCFGLKFYKLDLKVLEFLSWKFRILVQRGIFLVESFAEFELKKEHLVESLGISS